MPRRIASKLILSLTVLVAVLAFLFAWFNLRLQERQLLSNMVVGADQLSRSITSATWHAMLADNRTAAYEVMRTIAEKQGIGRIRIFNKDGRVMFSTDANDVRTVNKQGEACFVCHSRQEPLVRVNAPSRSRVFPRPGGGRMLGLITPIYNEPSCSTASCHAHPPSRAVLGVLDVALDLEPVDRELATMRLQSVVLATVQIVLLGIFASLFIRRFVDRPIRTLIHRTKALSEMRDVPPLALTSSQEIEDLARSFNVMSDRLGRAMDELRQFNEQLESKVEERTSQLRVAQQKLIQNDRLASLGQLAASVAHEINNPLSGVLNLSMLVQRILKSDGIPQERVEEVRGYLSQVATETARVGRIVSDLLAFSRRSRPHREPADLNAIVGNTVSLLSHKMALANVIAVLDLPPDLPRVPCDASQMQQVVMNLIVNAIEAIQGGGTVTVASRIARADGQVVLEVRDTGTGIPPDHMNKIFDPFFTTKEEGKGTGLGLAVAYGIVESHGGDIEVSSTLGAGTVFRVVLPLAARNGGGVASGPAAGPAERAG